MIKPIKHLGQNFLASEKIARDIVNAADIGPNDIVLEAGPGKGVLTDLLLKKAKKVIAVEKDRRLAEFLGKNFGDEIRSGKLELIYGDILKFNPSGYSLVASVYRVVANIPYYITSRFLRKFLSADPPAGGQPSLMVLTVQKEVAERIIGKGGKESLLSISVKACGKPKIIKKVPAGNFYPKPKVDSAIIKISQISKDFFKDINEEKFFEMVKKGFSQKRKMLINNLKCSPEVFDKCGVPQKARAENLSLKNWKCLIKGLSTTLSVVIHKKPVSFDI